MSQDPNAQNREGTRREVLLARLEGLPTLRADVTPPGSCCGYCAMHRHIFVHPHSLPERHWALEDGCPCCETHVPATDQSENVLWPHDAPLGVAL